MSQDWQSFFLRWASQKLIWQQNSHGRNWVSEQLSGLLIHATSTPCWLLRPAFGCLFFLIVQASSFLIHPSFLKQSVNYLPLTVQHLLTYKTSSHARGHQVLPIQPLIREAEDSLWVASIWSMCLCSHA